MIIDKLNLLSDSQALTATAVSTDTIDLGAERKIGIGEPMSVVAALMSDADDSEADETYVVTLETDDNSAFTSAKVIATATITRGAVEGTKVVLPIPADESCERYIRMNYTLGGTTPSVTLKTFLTMNSMIQNDTVYASGVTIS